MRLDKLLSHLGIGTRKEVKKYIRKGYVLVNGETIKKDDYKVNENEDEVIFDGEVLQYQKFVYLMLHKPAGYICATHDQTHATVMDLIDGYDNFDLFPIGRLDKDTEGLLLLSNDGDFAHKLMSPNRHHSKAYYAMIDGVVTNEDVEYFSQGVTIDTGYTCKKSNLVILSSTLNSSEIEVEVFEGKFHQIKKMFEAVGKKVRYLKRIKIRDVVLDSTLKIGEFRELSFDELVDLKKDL
ncbi:MAG: pseudouridine synthase [Coprobacillaceae bacterium]